MERIGEVAVVVLVGSASPHDSKWLPNVGEPNMCKLKILLAA